MKCALCNENDATVHIKEVVEGDLKELYVCESCAAKKGIGPGSPASLTDFLFGVGNREDARDAEERVCPDCGMSLEEFRKRSRFGCPKCYGAFEQDLEPLLSAMHKGTRHIGKMPVGEAAMAKIAALQEALESAVASQNFEEAARLRDRLREVRSSEYAAASGERKGAPPESPAEGQRDGCR
jgi:protein arginine kinase activator